MMVQGVDVRLMKSGDPLIFSENWSKLALPKVSDAGATKRHRTPELLVVQHWDFHFAAPAPEDLHCSS